MDKETTQKQFYHISSDKVLENLKTSRRGLSDKEAQKRLEEIGPNVLEEKERITNLQILLNQFKSPLIFILLVAGSVTLYLRDWVDSGVIFLAVAVNSALGFYQEARAEKALAHLKTYLKDRIRVIRDNNEREMDTSEVVPGDIVHLTTGNRVPADARLLSVNNLSIDEAILTGESLPVEKNTEVLSRGTEMADRKNMAFGGTLVVAGSGLAVVTATQKFTEIGKIAELVAGAEKEETPLQRAIKRFAWIVAGFLLFVVAGIFALGIARGESVLDMFLVSVAVAVGSIPEGLPIALTVILAVGVERLAKKKGVVRKLLAAETLGSTTLILTDKTGTLTQAKMELSDIIPMEDLFSAGKNRQGPMAEVSGEQTEVLELALVNSNVLIENPKEKPSQWRLVGAHLERNIVKAAAKLGILYPEFTKERDFFSVIPFDSKIKFSAFFVSASKKFKWDHLANKDFLVFLGAPDILIERSNLKKEEKEKALKAVEDLSYKGNRVLGVAIKIGHAEELKGLREDNLAGLQMAGILAFHDPIRPEVVEAMAKVNSFGTKVAMVTGDLKGTAISVAKELGWVVEEDNVIVGAELRKMSDAELAGEIDDIKIFARVSPEDKTRITRIFKEKGEIVAVSGDGVNDAPSLKTADIGIAVGSGTDVTKDVADLVLLDDNFKTVVLAIEEGKKIISNIKKVVVYLLSDSLNEVLLIGGSLLFGLPLPLTALQILYVNFFSDSFPALAFAFEEQYENTKPKKRGVKGHIFDNEVKFMVLVVGTLSSAFLFLMYWFLLKQGFAEDIVRTFIFSVFGIYTLLVAFSLRSLKKSIFEYNPFSNRYLLAGVAFGIVLMGLAIYMPFMQSILGTASLPALWLSAVVAVSLVNVSMVEITKLFFRKVSW
ncbi:MAG: HAD-IC family P-type ATPase [Candidatus Spechtbacterales bacterium]